ncbi:glycosyltransferase family 4 protein [Roseburia hominis]
MKILILANIDMGLYKFRRELLETLVEKHEVYFCVPGGEFVEKIEAIGCKFVSCNVLDRRSTNPIKDLKLVHFYRKTISNIKPDVVLTYTIKPNVYGGLVCGRKGIPYIANVTGLGTTIENGGLLATISISLYKIGLKKANCIFFQNKSNLKLFEDKGIVKGKTRLIPGSGVNLDTYCLEPYPSDSEGIHFLFVGRIMKDKGIEELLQAIHVIHNENKNVVLDIVGWGDEDYSKALEKAEKAGEIVNYGRQNIVHPFYAKCHCIVLPSYHEGMANVLLEASATGRPVIATRIPGCQEAFDENITGYGCEVKSVDSLIEAMRLFLLTTQNQRREMGGAARKKMMREYDRNIVINAYKQEIEYAAQR